MAETEMEGAYQSLFVRANGIKTHFIVAGKGAPLVLVHGGGPGASGEYGWRRNIPALAEHFQVFALDRIGFGVTDKPAITQTDQVLANHLADFIDALCLDQLYLMGNSMGAYGVARYAVDHPERVKKMVLVASGSIAGAMGVEGSPSEGQRAIRRFSEEPTRENMRAVLEGLLSNKSGITDELIDGRFRLATLPGAVEAQRSHRKYRDQLKNDPNLQQQYSLLHRLPQLTIPTIMIWGKQDRFAPIEYGYKLREMLPNLEAFHVFENSGHQVQNDEIEKFNKVVIDFLLER
jgi:2-hydroxy-6-oxonona-2,4-dienedioate hydrolase